MKNNFEVNMNKLDEISKKMGSDDITIQESIDLFKEAIDISRTCIDYLNTTKGEIELLEKKAAEIISTKFEINK